MDGATTHKLDILYHRYGYELKPKLSTNDSRVYILNKGVYFGADIISTEQSDEMEIKKTQDELSKAGYGSRVIQFSENI